MFNRPLNVKVRKIDPYRRMLHTHPFYIWQVLMRFRTMDKLIGVEHQWRTPEDIARQLFSNFDQLTDFQQKQVVKCKLQLPLAMLKSNYWITERETQRMNPNWSNRPWEPMHFVDKHNEWQGRAHAFGDIDQLSIKSRHEYTAEAIDRTWALWIGRVDHYAKTERWLKKRGLLPA